MISRVRRNLVANLVGVGWAAFAQLLCIPIYVHTMGIESYGLIGFHVMLTGALQILDLGLSPTMNREMARYSVQTDKADEARDLVRTLEIGYWSLGVIIGLAVVLAAPFIASHWISSGHLSPGTVQQAVVSMGIITALQWPLSFYVGGLMGLQRQVLVNIIRVVMGTASHGGAVLMLWYYSPTITAYFTWQMGVVAVQVMTVTYCLWANMPRAPQSPRFRPALIWGIWRFAAGMSGITLSALILTQLDKVMLSKLLSLEEYGYYTLAGVLASGLYVVIGPIFSTFFPRFSTLVAEHNEAQLKSLYHRSMQIMAVLILPVAAVVAVFAEEILVLWTGNPVTAHISAPIVSWLVMGTALNGLMNLPYALQLAYGWTRLGLLLNLCFVVAMVPAIYVLVINFGAVGGAFAWFCLNAVYLAVGLPLTHARLLKGELTRWLTIDVGLPLVGVVLVVGLGKLLMVNDASPMVTILWLVGLVLLSITTAATMAPAIRELVRQLFLALHQSKRKSISLENH